MATVSRLLAPVPAAAVALVLFLLPAIPALADTTINVDATCSLANAIRSANGDAQTGSTMNQCEDGTDADASASPPEDGNDIIVMSSSVNLGADLPSITSKLTLNGNNRNVSGQNTYALFVITASADVTINDLGIGYGKTVDNGGGIHLRGKLTLNRVTLIGNNATLRGGGIYAQNADLTINRGNFRNNSAQNGGGIYHDMGGSKVATATTINNSMIFDNSAPTGGGIFLTGSNTYAASRLHYVTITRNSSTVGGGGIYNETRDLQVSRSIIYGNTGSDCKLADSPVVVIQQSIIHSSSDTDCKKNTSPNSEVSTADPLLVPPHNLQSFPHFRLYVGSPALNAADPSESGRENCWSNTVDYLGTTRPVGTGCEYGAWEGEGVARPATATPTETATATATATQVQNALIQNDEPPPEDENPPPEDEDPPPGNNDPPPGNNDPPGSSGSSASGSGKQRAVSLFATPTALPRASTCLTLEGIWVDGVTQWTQCQRVSGYAIGNAEVAAAAVDAVDVWGWVLPNTKICFFAAGGSFKFIDTGFIPRVVYDLPAYSQNGMSCAIIDRPGILALQPGAPVPQPTSTPAPRPRRDLFSCMVRTNYILNLRAGPGGDVINLVPWDVTLTAMEKSGGWYKVDYHGQQGWVSADLVEAKGSCD